MYRQKLYREFILADLSAMKKFAARFAPLLAKGDVVALDGSLGTGKTEFCRAVIHALGYKGEVPSPTFNLLQIYQPGEEDRMAVPVWHLDLYRLTRPEEAFELGIEDGFEAAISLIEWPSRLGPCLPGGFLTLRLEIETDGAARKLTLIGGPEWRSRLGEIPFDD